MPSYCGSYRLEYLDGEMVVNRCNVEHNDFGYRSYVVEVEGRFLPGSDKTQSYWVLNTPEHGISVWYPGYGYMDDMEYPSGTIPISANPGTESNTLMIIVNRPGVAFYLNGQPLYYLEDATIEYGKFSLYVYNPDQGQGGPMVTIVAFDNFKIWDISDLP